METKPFWASKTLWVNFLAFVALLVQQVWGYAVPADLQAYALVAINLLLRWVTKSGLSA